MDLTKTQTQGISSLAKPSAPPLLAARTAIAVAPALQAIFAQAREEKLPTEALAERLYVNLQAYVLEQEGLWDVALYLADEFCQLGEGRYLVSTETGKVIYKITDADIYIPPSVSRETGISTASAAPRLRPDLEAALIEWQFTNKHEHKLVEAITKRGSTQLLGRDDRRLQRVTRAGRRQLVDNLREELPTLFQTCATMRSFLEFFTFEPETTYLESLVPMASSAAYAKVRTQVSDPLTFNLRYDPYALLKQQIVGQWARDIARAVATLSSAMGPTLESTVAGTPSTGIWLAEPNTALALSAVDRVALPIAGIPTTHLQGNVGAIVVDPQSYECQGREVLDRWEVEAGCTYTLYLPRDLSVAIKSYKLTGVPDRVYAAEVVS